MNSFPNADDTIDVARETSHRLANSLQMLAATVSMSAREITDPAAQDALVEVHRRIQAIARLHRHLYAMRDAEKFDLADYIVELARDLEDGYCAAAGARRVVVEARSVFVTPEEALAVGILVSELVSNACKYAYELQAAGDIRILLRTPIAGGYAIVVEDRGVGLHERSNAGGTGLGLRLIDAMTTRLKGIACWENALPGTRFTISVPG